MFTRFALSTLVVAAALSLASPSIGRAQDADVKAAVDAYHAAIRSRNISDIAAVWSHDGDVSLVNPNDTTIALGWDAVKAQWDQVFNVLAGLEITQTDGPHVSAAGDVAWSVGIVRVALQFKSGAPKDVNYLETDVFVKRDGRWLLASHTAKPM